MNEETKLVLKKIDDLRDYFDGFKDYVQELVGKLFERMDMQNEKIISAQKDIEYIQINFNKEIDRIEKVFKEDIDGMGTALREHKEEVKKNIQDGNKKGTMAMKLWVLVLATGVLYAIIMVLLNFIGK